MSLKQLKTLMDQKKFVEVVQQAEELTNRDSAKNKPAYLFLAQAQIELEMPQEAQSSLNMLYSVLQVGSNNKNDDTLYHQALITNQKIAAKMQNDQNASKQIRQAGRQLQKDNQFKIIEFFDMGKKYVKMLDEMETYLALLLQDEQFKDMEDNLLWLLNHQAVPEGKKVEYACRIHDIDQFYNPYTKIEKALNMVLTLQGVQRPYPESMNAIAMKTLNFLERQNWRKDLHSAVNQLNMNKGSIEEFQRYNKSAVPATEIVFTANPTQMLFGGDKSACMHFLRAIMNKTFTLQFNSEEWKTYISDLTKVTQMEVFQATLGDMESNPMQLAIYSILDIDRIMQTAELPDTDSNQDLFFVKYFSVRENAHEILMDFSKQFKGLSPLVNLYVLLCITSLGWCGTKITVEEAMTKLNLASYLQRSIYKNRIGPKNQPSDMQVLSCILNMRLAQFLPQDKRAENISTIGKTMEAIQKFAGAEIISVYLNEQAQIQWKVHLSAGRWQDAILELERVAEAVPSKAPWVKVRVAWIQYSFIDRIAKDEQERKLFMNNIFNQLQEAQAANDKDAEVLLMQGTMLFLNATELGALAQDPKACCTKWLLALKRDQTNAETFYCLAVYYLCREKNLAKAQKCLDKALLLRPDFEEAFLLNYCLLHQESKPEAAFALVGKMQSVNRNVASTYYLGGLAQLREGNYIQAIDDLQNATRFYTISRQNNESNKNSLRVNYPLPKEIMNQNTFTLLKAKLGLFGSHEKQFVAVWVHLIQCFFKIDKPQVALKCFARAMEEIETILGENIGDLAEQVTDMETQQFTANLVTQVKKISQADRLKMIESNEQLESVVITLGKINQVLDRAEQTGAVPAILIEFIECLTMGAKISADINLSIQLAMTGLRICSKVNLSNQLNSVETLITFLIQRFTDKISTGSLISFGQVTIPAWISNQLQLLEDLIGQCDQRFSQSQTVQQASIHALFAISQKCNDSEKEKQSLHQCFLRVESLIQSMDLRPDSQTVFGQCARSLLLDAAKLALKCELIGVKDEDLAQKKLKYAKQALMLDPENAELWVHLHLCFTAKTEKDKAMRAQAIFKAYQLDPDMPFVQEHLLKHYLSSPSTYSKAFHMILRTNQQEQASQLQTQQQATLPIITAVLAFLNARAYFSTPELSQRRNQRKNQLLQAVSLINLIEQRDDLIQMFQSLQFFLQHQKGDYLQTIKYLEHLCDDQGDDILKLILIEAYLGVKIHDFPTLKAKLNQFGQEMKGDKYTNLLQQANQLLELSKDSPIKERAEALISSFKESPQQVAQQLILLQEFCIEQNVLPDNNILDLDEEIMQQIEQLELTDQRTLIIQSLIFCQIRDGEIASNARIQDGLTGEFTEEEKKDDNKPGKDYLRYLIKASRIKPKIIDSIQTHKDLLFAKLTSLKNPHMHLGEPLKQPDNPKDRAYIGLEQLIKFNVQKLLFAQKQLMKDPTSLRANINFVQGLIYNSRMPEALKTFNLIKQKMKTPLIDMNEASEADLKALEQIDQILNQLPIASDSKPVVKTISSLCNQNRLEHESEDPEEFSFQMIERVAVGLVKTILSTQRPKKQIQLVSELSFLLHSLVLQRGQHNIFVKLVERMLAVTTSLTQTQTQIELLNLLWGYKCLSKTSALFEMKKNASSTQEANLAVKVLRNGFIVREPIPGILLQARSYQLVRNENQASSALDLTSDDPSVVRDIIMALGLFAQQAYKQFYLTALGLVAGSKTQIEKMKETVLGEAKLQAYYTLAYAYYLKAFAECTFLAARRQDITLAEDFDTEEDGQSYDQDFFRKKARTSLAKANRACWHARDLTGDLKKAIDFMLTQTN